MQLFLSKSLVGWSLSKGKEQTSELRGGKYAARVQTGYEKDGSPRYRYFQTQQEYEEYMRGKGRKKRSKSDSEKKEGKTRLAEIREKEQKESRAKQLGSFVTVGHRAEADKKDDKKEDKKTNKSLTWHNLYLKAV